MDETKREIERMNFLDFRLIQISSKVKCFYFNEDTAV